MTNQPPKYATDLEAQPEEIEVFVEQGEAAAMALFNANRGLPPPEAPEEGD